MGRPRKIKPVEQAQEPTIGREYVKPILHDPKFGFSRPAPKPSSTKKKRGAQEDE